MKIVLPLLLSAVCLFSQEVSIDNLLKQYGNSQELYLKTKEESAGHIVLFSRSDLDKMQAYTLNDVIKTVRLFNIQPTNVGMTTLVKAGTTQQASPSVRVYINSHELHSATLGNALAQYGKMGLYFVDHIEIYQAASAISFGNEPAAMIIKLYTKDPSRENATSIQASADTRGSSRFQAIEAKSIDEYSYLANIDINKMNYKEYEVDNHILSRDALRGQLYLSFSKEDSYDVEVGATAEDHDIFNGFGSAPTSGEFSTKDAYIRLTKYLNNDLTISIDASLEELDVYNQDDGVAGIKLSDNSTSNNLEFEVSSQIYNAIIEKKFTLIRMNFLLGHNLNIKSLILMSIKAIISACLKYGGRQNLISTLHM